MAKRNQKISKYKILLVDDDEDDYLIINSLITKISKSPFELEWESNPARAAQLIGSGKHDIYLIDYRLGNVDGLELLSQFDLIQRPEPFIVLTGAGDERIESEAMKLGVADYLVKGSFDKELLARVLQYSIQRKRLEAQRLQHLINLNRTKDEFIALASHQLRTPATAVKQYVGLLLEGYSDPLTTHQRALLEKAYESNERQIHTVDDLLKVAQADKGKVTIHKTNQDISQLVSNIIRDIGSEFEKRNQELIFKRPDNPVIVQIDRDYMRMALENVIDNSSKYSGNDKTITVTVFESKDNVTVKIADEGVGIPSASQHKLFQKFSRIDNELSIEVGGTGLGLYWTKQVIDLHKGAVTVKSKENHGTTFTVCLPK